MRRKRAFALLSFSMLPCALTFAACAVPHGTGDAGRDTTKIAQAVGTTYDVGPGRPYATLQDVAAKLAPGDVVNVYDNGSSYAGGLVFTEPGTKAAPITIRGVRSGATRPKLAGGTDTVEFQGDHYVFEGFDVSGGSFRCVYHHDDDLTVRDSVVHDCPAHGIQSADEDSGSLTLDYVEVYKSGGGTQHHPVYVASDETAHPGSVFRMQHCYLHDEVGGNNVKSRAERNEIYYNWVEGALYRELELIDPDGQDPSLAREDSDVVGNVLYQTQGTSLSRIGGDGSNDGTSGRYRFVDNTFVLDQGTTVLQAFDKVESLEMHNNVFYRRAGGGVKLLDDSNATWVAGAAVTEGHNNWLPTGSSEIPAGFAGTLIGTSPGFRDVASRDIRPAAGSPLLGAGAGRTVATSPPGHLFPLPLLTPTFEPPLHALEPVNGALARAASPVDIGGYGRAASGGGGAGGSSGAGGAGAASGAGGSAGAGGDAGAPCVTGSGTWQNETFTTETGHFVAWADLTPGTSGEDAAFTLGQGSGETWTSRAVIVLFGDGGTISARKGGGYAADTTIAYQAGVTYHARLDVNVQAHTYSVWITAPGRAEVSLAANYPFRTEQASVTDLDTWGIAVDAGSLRVCGFVAR